MSPNEQIELAMLLMMVGAVGAFALALYDNFRPRADSSRARPHADSSLPAGNRDRRVTAERVRSS